MNNSFFGNHFPNNLQIARRKVKEDDMVKKISLNIEKIETAKNSQNKYLKRYLENSIKIGEEN